MAERYDFYVHDNRKVTFNLTEPIMREDNGVTDFVFHIPKVLNELEVSDWAWWLVFVNAKKEKYSIALTLSDDPESPLEKNVATYTVDYAMSIKAGSVQFALEAINAGTGGAIDNEWHTLTYETKVKETLQGNQAEYAETESDVISALLIEVRNKVNQLVGGATPTPVASVSAMTDPSKLYLLTTDGNWYYHNGSAWVSGGVYGAGIVDSAPTQGSTNAVSSGGVYSALHDTDTTLSQSGQAADAKVTGDEITDLKEDLGDISEKSENLFQFLNTTKIVNNVSITTDSDNNVTFNGTASSNGGRLTAFTDDFVLKAGTYTIGQIITDSASASLLTRCAVSLQKRASGTNVIATASNPQTPVTFTLDEDTTCYIGFNLTNAQVYNNVKMAVMLNAGTTLKEYQSPQYVSAIDRLARTLLDYYNLQLDVNAYTNGFITGEGVESPNQNSIITKKYIPTYIKGFSVDDGYRVVVIRFKDGLFFDRQYYITSASTSDISGFNYVFSSEYEYRIYFEKSVSEKVVDIYSYAKAVTFYVSPHDIGVYISSEMEQDNAADEIKANDEYRLGVLMYSTYDIKFANSARKIPLFNVYGNTQNVHPKVLYFPEKFGGHYYWMAYTPYPFGILKTENPCIAYSDDGVNWVDDFANNPLDNTDELSDSYYNSDTHLVYANGNLECWYRLVANGHEEIYRRTTSDGVTWTAKELLYTSTSGSLVLAPTVIYDSNDSKYKIWVVNNEDRGIDYFESTTGSDWTFIRKIQIVLSDGGYTYTPWHGDVICDTDRYIMVMMGKAGDKWDTFIATSTDNINYGTPTKIIEGRIGKWDAQMYRPSITKVGTEYVIYYSARTGVYYGLGITKSNTLNNYIGVNY